jgi:tetratricopeptide (TPR) repeat protein
MIELYSVKDVAKIFGQTESRLRYWIQSGFLWPSVRRGGQYFYTFDDLITIRTAVELLDSGISVQKVRKALAELRSELPKGVTPAAKLRICSDGSSVVVIKDDIAYEAQTKQLVMAFAVSSIKTQIAEILPIRGPQKPQNDSATPQPIAVHNEQTLKQELPSAYQLFLHAGVAEQEGDDAQAERYLRQCLALEDSMAAAHTNLGNLLHKQERLEEAKEEYDLALLHDPEQPEARFNLGNLLEEMGNREMAITELRQVCTRSPDFADAHYNLGVLLAEIGGATQAQEHLMRYLTLDPESQWADQARQFLAS